MFTRQLLANNVGIAPMLPEPFRQPVLEPVQRPDPARLAVTCPAPGLNVTPHRIAAATQLRRNALRPPAQSPQTQHCRDFFRCPHLLVTCFLPTLL